MYHRGDILNMIDQRFLPPFFIPLIYPPVVLLSHPSEQHPHHTNYCNLIDAFIHQHDPGIHPSKPYLFIEPMAHIVFIILTILFPY